jgi:hypothetical protein
METCIYCHRFKIVSMPPSSAWKRGTGSAADPLGRSRREPHREDDLPWLCRRPCEPMGFPGGQGYSK